VQRIFDLTADVDAFQRLAAGDEILGPLVARQPHIRLPQLADRFEALIRAILGQQVSVAAAATMTERVVRLLAVPATELDGEPFLAFPTPDALAATRPDALRGIGLTRAKTESVLAAASAAATTLELDALPGLAPEEADARLVGVRGIGPWTAAYLRMRAFGDRDAFPASDLGIIKAMRAFGITRPADVLARAEAWRPWRAYAALHLWESLRAGG
jgi:3-methyladenine DNA glycosylase/8-oxoguanine DNA glycosylase